MERPVDLMEMLATKLKNPIWNTLTFSLEIQTRVYSLRRSEVRLLMKVILLLCTPVDMSELKTTTEKDEPVTA
jgi:hypothetical protein